MPELPEVETIVRDLDRWVRGARIARVTVERPDLIAGEPPGAFAAGLAGARVRGVARRAKTIVIDLGDQILAVNLGMTGRLFIAPPGAALPAHLGVRFQLDDGRSLLYQDVRRFGRLRRQPQEAWHARAAAFGHEPLAPEFTAATLHALARRSRSPIKPWLMDQRRVVGVGNIYASEALHRAGIDPRRAADSLSANEAERLHRAIRTVLQEAIEFRGTTLLDYRDAGGEPGGFAARLQVYDRAGEPCRRCAAPIQRIVQAGRSTFFCPACQR